ncbi:MAG: glycosyltransferase family 2 protein [Thermodesulfobacteriota bacterium]
MSIRVSIVIPNRDYARFLPDLFASIGAQTSGLGDVEAVFADDASGDDSLAVARELGARLPFARFTARAFPPMGHPALTRNAGMALAAGDTILFMDPDDTIEPDFLRECLIALDAGAGVAYTGYVEHGPSGAREVSPPDFAPAILRTQNIPVMGSLMRRDVFEAVGGFRADCAYEDWDFWVRAAARGVRFARVARPLYNYRLHGVNFSREAQAGDGPAKAAIVLGSPEFFPPEVRRWAKAVTEGKPWAMHFGRGLIPREEDVRLMRGIWAKARKARKDG